MKLYRIAQIIAVFVVTWIQPAWSEEERMAVLEIQAATLTVDERMVLTDEIRGAAIDTLRGRILVMTRENMEVMLTDMGIDTCIAEGSCEVETARNLGAHYVITGTISPFGDQLAASLKLHDARTGALLNTERVSATRAVELLNAFPEATFQLLAPLGGNASGGFESGKAGVQGRFEAASLELTEKLREKRCGDEAEDALV